MRGVSWIAEDLLQSQKGLCSMKLVKVVAFDLLLGILLHVKVSCVADILGECYASIFGITISRTKY